MQDGDVVKTTYLDQPAQIAAAFAEMAKIVDEATVQEAAFAAGQIVAERMRLAINNPPKTGVVYRHGRIEHQASSPGQAPATDMGELANSIGVKKVAWGAEVQVGAEYGAALELGTAKMKPRPYLRPSLDEDQDELLDAMQAVVAKRVEP